MNIDGIQALMDHTNPLAKFVQWLSFLFAGKWVRLSLFIYHIPSVPWYDLTVSLYFTISSPWLLSWPPWHLLQQPGTQMDFNNQNHPQSPTVDFEQLRTLFEEWRVRVVPGFSVPKNRIATWPLVTAIYTMKPFQQIFGPWGGAIRRQMAKEVNKHISTQSSKTNHSQKRGQEGKGWARTQMQVLRDCSHIPTAATKADSCSKQNQIKKTLAKRQHQTKELVPISLYVLLRPSPLMYFSKLPAHLCTR